MPFSPLTELKFVSAATIPSLGQGQQYVVDNIITIPQANLIAAGFTGTVGVLTLTLGASNITADVANKLFYGYLTSPYSFHIKKNTAELVSVKEGGTSVIPFIIKK